MNHKLKRNIRLLAEKLNYQIHYDQCFVMLTNKVNTIKVWQEDKYGIHFSYNVGERNPEYIVPFEHIYDPIISLSGRKSQTDEYEPKTGSVITVDGWIKEEGEYIMTQLNSLKKDLSLGNVDYREFSGNRFMGEYYKGILILIDDLSWVPSNVIHVESIQ